jgi:hypothetical protein
MAKKEFFGYAVFEKKDTGFKRISCFETNDCFQDTEGSEEGMYVVLGSFTTDNRPHTDLVNFMHRRVKITVETLD